MSNTFSRWQEVEFQRSAGAAWERGMYNGAYKGCDEHQVLVSAESRGADESNHVSVPTDRLRAAGSADVRAKAHPKVSAEHEANERALEAERLTKAGAR